MAIWIVLPILTLLMFDLGLSLKFEDFGKVFRAPWPIVVALVGQLVLLPLIALGLAAAFDLQPVFFIGLVLIACCPGGSSSNVFSKLAGGGAGAPRAPGASRRPHAPSATFFSILGAPELDFHSNPVFPAVFCQPISGRHLGP